MFQEKQILSRKEKRKLARLWKSSLYTKLLWLSLWLFRPSRRFFLLPFKGFQKLYWIISVSIYSLFWKKIAYVDDFIIHKKLRGRWYAQKLFSYAENHAQKKNCDVVLLTSNKKRKASHKFYKKAGFTIISFWIGIIAYKIISKNK